MRKWEHLLFLDRLSGAANQAMDLNSKSNRKKELKGMGFNQKQKERG